LLLISLNFGIIRERKGEICLRWWNKGVLFSSHEEVEVEEEEEEKEDEEEEIEEVDEEDAMQNHSSDEAKVEDEDEKKKHAELLALPPHGSKVYIGGIPHDVSNEDLKSFCKRIGEVAEVSMCHCCCIVLMFIDNVIP